MKRLLLLVGANLAILIVLNFSRQRQFRSDVSAAKLLGSPQPIVAAPRRLGGVEATPLPQNLVTAGVKGRLVWMAWFSSHPPIAQRIEALDRFRQRN